MLALAAEFRLESGDDEGAERHLTHALAIDPDHRQALILHARLLFRQGRRQEALPEAEHACTLDPNDLSTLTLLSSIQSSLGLGKQAGKTLDRKREVQQRFELMEKLAKEIIANPQAPEPRWRLGQLAAQANMKPLAIQSYEAALAQAPTFEPARQALLDLGFPASRLPPLRNPRSRTAPREWDGAIGPGSIVWAHFREGSATRAEVWSSAWEGPGPGRPRDWFSRSAFKLSRAAW